MLGLLDRVTPPNDFEIEIVVHGQVQAIWSFTAAKPDLVTVENATKPTTVASLTKAIGSPVKVTYDTQANTMYATKVVLPVCRTFSCKSPTPTKVAPVRSGLPKP